MGILFAQYVFIYIMASRFRIVLLNSKAPHVFFCFCLLFCFSELLGFMITMVCDGALNFRYHMTRFTMVVLQWGLCLLVAIFSGKIRDRNAT
jgi:hypothetical protein